jgi:LmbE family N-acetylglucosaminyl deacetylase
VTERASTGLPREERRVAMSFLAHPDDAEILCAGTMIRLREEHGYELHIVTATAGDCGTLDRSPDEISAIRTAEAAQSASLLGANYHCLGEADGLVVYDKPTIRKTIELYRRLAPTVVFTHAPADYMLDHEQTSLLARAASFIAGAPNASQSPLLPGHGIPYLYYCDPVEGLDPLGVRVRPTTYVPISPEFHALKLRMLACHASQREWLRAHHGMDEYIEAVKRHDESRAAEMWKTGVDYAESFIQHRGHAYPADDLLTQLLTETAACPVP